MRTEVCPVCQGKGRVRFDFYRQTLRYDGVFVRRKVEIQEPDIGCRRCQGSGTVVTPEDQMLKTADPISLKKASARAIIDLR